MIQRNRIRRQSLSQVELTRDDKVDFKGFVVVSFDIKIMRDRARMRLAGYPRPRPWTEEEGFFIEILLRFGLINPLLPNFTRVKRLGE